MATLTAAQCRAARALLNWTLDDLALVTTKVGRRTIINFENCRHRAKPETVEDLRQVFEQAGVAFIEMDGSAGGAVLLPPPAKSLGQ